MLKRKAILIIMALSTLSGKEIIKLKGDFRMRGQWDKWEDTLNRYRLRIRFRLGAKARISDMLTVYSGLATGGADARSTNQTLEEGFSSKNIKLDYAFMEMNLKPLTLKMGKIKSIKNLIFRPSDLLWDSDINPEGLNAEIKIKNEKITLNFNAGLWMLDEYKTEKDPFMIAAQPVIKFDIDKNKSIKIGIAGYLFENVKENILFNGADYSGKYNTVITDTSTQKSYLKYNYNSAVGSFELQIDKISLYAEYCQNFDPEENNTAYIGGVKIKLGKFTIGYDYRELQKDAWLDIFPNSDAYSGHTDIKGHKLSSSLKLTSNLKASISFYKMKRISEDDEKQVLQIDLQTKF